MKAFAAPDVLTEAPLGAAGGIAEVTLALAAVLATVFALAWLLRKARGLGRPGGAHIEVLAEAALGARERAVLVRVGGRQLLLGVAPGSLRTLHVLEKTDESAAVGEATNPQASPRAPSFRELLARSLGR